MTIRELLRYRADDYPMVPTPEELADSLSCERFPVPKNAAMRRALVAFRHLRGDARVAAASAALRFDS